MENKIKMPGYGEKRKKSEIDARNARILEDQRKTEEEMRRVNEKAAALERAKKDIIEKTLPGPELDKNYKSHLAAYARGLRTAAKIQLISFAIGAGIYSYQDYDWHTSDLNGDGIRPFGSELVHAPYQNTKSFGQAVKNAYLMDGFSDAQGGSGTFQSVCGLIAMLITIGAAAATTQERKDEIDSENGRRANYNQRQRENHKKLVDYVYRCLDVLADEEIRADNSIFGREPNDAAPAPNVRGMYDVLQKYAMTLVPKMAEIDRHYFDNLLNGGLENANWDVANAIVAGHLKSHPEDYNEIIKIIDQATLDPALVKKYGKEGVVSFGAASAMMQNGRDK